MESNALRSSLWSHHLESKYPPLGDDRAVDVVVVGAGITGLLTATLLQQRGHDVLVVDRDVVGGVATRNSTAKVSALQGTTLSTIARFRGPKAAADYAGAQLDAVQGLRALINELDIECAATTADAVTFATTPAGAARVAAEFDAAQAAGLDVGSSASGLPFETQGAVSLAAQFHMHPADLCMGLANALGAGHVLEHTTTVDIDENKDGCVVSTEHGSSIRAEHVVVATQSPIVDPMLLANRGTPKQSYCLAARVERAVPDSMSLSADDLTISLRPATVDGERLLIVGGNGHHVGESATAARWDLLERWAAEHFGRIEVTHRWATHDLVATDHVPFIGRLHSRSQRRWVATAFGKWGMTNRFVAARLISDAIDERDPAPWASTFDATRVRSTITSEFVAAGITATQHLLGDRIGRRPEPRCTHQGCVLRRDEALGTWDCPCHGSRFDAKGTVLQGPANTSLKSP